MNENGSARQKQARREEGQSVILVAVAMVALIIFAAIAVDASDAYFSGRKAQNAADAAALAAGQELGRQRNANWTNLSSPINNASLRAAMNKFAEENSVLDTNGTLADAVNDNVVAWYLDENGDRLSDTPIGSGGSPALGVVYGVEVSTTIVAPTFFGGIVGANGLPVEKQAAVMLQGACGAGCVAPIAAHYTGVEDYSPGTCINIYNGSDPQGGLDPGQFGWLNWNHQNPSACTCNAGCVESNLDPNRCPSGPVSKGDIVNGDGGVSNAAGIRHQLNYYCGSACDSNYGVPHPFTVVVWDWYTPGGGCQTDRTENGTFHVYDLAEVQLLGYQLSAGQFYGYNGTEIDPLTGQWRCADLSDRDLKGNVMTVKFIKWVGGQAGNCNSDSELKVVRLVK